MIKIGLQFFARVGFKYPVYAIGTETAGIMSYTNGAVIGKGINADVNINFSNLKLYADDTVAETNREFLDGTITLGVDDLSDAVKVGMLGFIEGVEVDAITHAKELSPGDTMPIVGYGGYAKKASGGWTAKWIKKVQFAQPNDAWQTKGQSIQYNTPVVVGDIMKPENETFSAEGTFSTEAGAIAWLRAKAGISTDVSTGLTALSITNGTLTPVFDAAVFNYSCAATGNVDFTATAAGTIKLYIDGVYNSTLVTTVKGSAITTAIGSNRIFQIVCQESGKAPITTTIIVQRAA